MRTTTKECNHCGIEYSYHLSGNHIPDYNSDTYCPGCEKVRYNAIKEAFKEVPVLFTYQYIPTDDYTLEEILKIEKDKRDAEQEEWQRKVDAGAVLFPLMRRVYSNLYSTELGEHSKTGRVEYNGESYSYFYWPSKPEEAKVTVLKRIDMTTGEPVLEFKPKSND